MVDDDAYLWASTYRWCALKGPNTYYADRAFFTSDGKQKHNLLHRAIMGWSLTGLEIDHIDGNGLNNQRSNLRFVTKTANQRNRIEQRQGGLRGVRQNSSGNWQAYIHYLGKFTGLGSYKSQEDAYAGRLFAEKFLSLE